MQSYICLTNMLLETNDTKEALRKIRTLYTLNKTSCAANFAYAAALMKAEMYEDALNKFLAAIEINENYTPAYLGAAECSFYCGKYNDSLKLLDRIMDVSGAEEDFLVIQERVLEKIVSDDTYCEVDFAIKYCNKFLERYNNSKVSEIRDTLVGKNTK